LAVVVLLSTAIVVPEIADVSDAVVVAVVDTDDDDTAADVETAVGSEMIGGFCVVVNDQSQSARRAVQPRFKPQPVQMQSGHVSLAKQLVSLSAYKKQIVNEAGIGGKGPRRLLW
jgi:hypothetical protein